MAHGNGHAEQTPNATNSFMTEKGTIVTTELLDTGDVRLTGDVKAWLEKVNWQDHYDAESQTDGSVLLRLRR